MSAVERQLPIGVFDSGIGGLTVLRALMERLPGESFLYLGDTARLPYGTKTAATVERYALQAVDELVRRGVKALVIACNTASAAALPALAAAHPQLPVVGVIEPGAAAAVAATKTGRIAVLATEGTVRGGAYQREISRRLPDAQVTAVAATLFVALAEEGWVRGEIPERVAQRYLAPLFTGDAAAPDTLVLGCTHFLPLLEAIRAVVGLRVQIVDSAFTSAGMLARLLEARALRTDVPGGHVRFLVSDGEERFARVGPVFLGTGIAVASIERVDLQGNASRRGFQSGNG
ncbi:MAG TPA: glutamate racemase [Steroidobacteraceae bacterium]|nr:glutamate racemase [Steroidobacteraceae bacterium]